MTQLYAQAAQLFLTDFCSYIVWSAHLWIWVIIVWYDCIIVFRITWYVIGVFMFSSSVSFYFVFFFENCSILSSTNLSLLTSPYSQALTYYSKISFFLLGSDSSFCKLFFVIPLYRSLSICTNFTQLNFLSEVLEIILLFILLSLFSIIILW